MEAKSLSTLSPEGIGPEFFREMGVVINAVTGGPPDRAKMAEIMRRHGLTSVAPPST